MFWNQKLVYLFIIRNYLLNMFIYYYRMVNVRTRRISGL